MIKKIYKKLKKLPVIGLFAVLIRNIVFNKYVNLFLLKRNDFKNVKKILLSISNNSDQVNKIFKEINKAIFIRKNFSHGHSCNYQVMLLYGLIRLIQPDIVIETGVASGRSSTAILEAMNKNNKGKLFSIDLFETYDGEKPQTYITVEGNQENCGFIPKGKKPGWLIPDEFRGRWELIIGKTRDKLPELINKLESVDIFYHDSEHSYENMTFEFNAVWPKMKENSFLVCDDYKWNNAFNEFVNKNGSEGKVYKYRSLGIVQK